MQKRNSRKKQAKDTHAPPRQSVKKLKTGIVALDSSLGGGIRIPSALLLIGPPGSGKTAVCVQFAAAGEDSMYIATNNYPEEIKQIAKGLRADLKTEFVDGYSWLIGKAGGVNLSDLTGFLETLDNKLETNKVERVCFDSLSSLFMYNTEKQVEKFVQAMIALVKNKRACMLIAVEDGTLSQEMRNMLEFLTDGTIELKDGKLFIKRVNGIKPKKREFRFAIGTNGVELE